MSEISVDDRSPPTPGQPPLPARPPIQNISVWVEKFCWHPTSYRSTQSCLPIRPRLLELNETLMTAAGLPVTVAIHRREALAQKNLDWSVPNARPQLHTGWPTGQWMFPHTANLPTGPPAGVSHAGPSLLDRGDAVSTSLVPLTNSRSSHTH